MLRPSTIFAVLCAAVFSFVALATPARAADPTFTFAVLPDTQMEVHHPGDGRFADRARWLVNNRAALDLRFVASVGDLVNWDTADHAQYQVAASGLDLLHNAGIRYTVAPGNHDTAAVCPGGSACNTATTRTTIRDTSTFNRYFTAADFGNVSNQFEAGQVDNVYTSHGIDGLQWGVLSLELWPRASVVSWARAVVAAHPHANIVVVTHSYLNADGSIAGSGEYGAMSPQYLYDNLIKQYPQIKMVFSGHVGSSATRVDTGVHGNRIYSFLQSFHDQSTNPVRLVTVNTAAGTVSSRVYAPWTNTSYPAWATPSVPVAWLR